ncbi:proline-rich transmembrane protein 4 [Polymixia lowei]
MLLLHRTLALGFWCCLLVTLHGQGLADEEGLWGPTPPRERPEENPPESKPHSYWWTRSLPKLPSISPPLFRIPFSPWGGNSQTTDEAVGLTATTEGLTEPIDRSGERSGSGEGSVPKAFEPPTAAAQDFPAGVTGEIRTGSLPEGTSDSPHRGAERSNNDTLVSDSYSPSGASIEDAPFSDGPAGTSAPALHATRTHPPQDAVQTTVHSLDAMTTQHLPVERSDEEEVADFPKELLTPSTIASETTVPTSLTWTPPQTTTINPGLVETTLTRHPLGSIAPPTSPGTMLVATPGETTVSVSSSTTEATMTEVQPTQTQAGLGFSEAKSVPVEEQPGFITTAMGNEGRLVLESITSTTQSPRVNFSVPGEMPDHVDETEKDSDLLAADRNGETSPAATSPASAEPSTTTTTSGLLTAGGSPKTHIPLSTEDWLSSSTDSDITLLPDCNQERSEICNLSDTWDAATSSDASLPQNATAINQSSNPFLIPAPPMLVPLYTDWNSAMAAWGLAWEAHVYGVGCVFTMVTLASALNLLCLPLRCPSGCGYFALVSLFLLAAGCTRAFSLLYDAYGHQDRLPSTEASLMLYEAPFPCLTAAFGLVFLLLSMRSRMQLSYSAFQRPCFLACLVVLHFAAAFGPVTLLKFYQQKPPLCLFLSLISRGAFVALATFLSAAYFVFYIYVRADSKHIYHLNNTSPTPAERYNRCPFAESRDWERAAVTVCLSALFSLACAGLQLYAMLNAMGIAGGEEVFRPWPWWAFQFSCRVCELGVCLTLALVVAQPVYCSDHLPAAGTCWTELLATKSPILPGSYQWTLSQQEKLAIVDTVGLGESESLPLYTLVDDRLGSSLNGLDLLYHSNRALAYRDLDLDLPGLGKPEDGGGGAASGGSSYTSDSTADLRPPSPINLRRSIDEALFSEALFPMSLFSPSRPIRCSDLSLNNHSTLPNGGQALCDPLSIDPGLYRTSSCVEMASQPQPQPPCSQPREDTVLGAPPSPSLSSSTSCSSPERWRGSSSSCSLYRPSLGGSSLVLCPSPERHAQHPPQEGESDQMASSSHEGPNDLQRHYHTLGSASQESLDLDMSSEADRSVQEEFISVCRQIDALSICSETIDL